MSYHECIVAFVEVISVPLLAECLSNSRSCAAEGCVPGKRSVEWHEAKCIKFGIIDQIVRNAIVLVSKWSVLKKCLFADVSVYRPAVFCVRAE